jgi:PIN domain nuclease of toxin-antitoxin system
MAEAIGDYGFLPLAIELAHGDAVRALPPHHRDPFDRMLVAQARLEGLVIVSRDALLTAYDVPIVWE